MMLDVACFVGVRAVAVWVRSEGWICGGATREFHVDLAGMDYGACTMGADVSGRVGSTRGV